jgi:hypothetical protein
MNESAWNVANKHFVLKKALFSALISPPPILIKSGANMYRNLALVDNILQKVMRVNCLLQYSEVVKRMT